MRGQIVALTESRTGGGANLLTVNLTTGAVRKVALLPFGGADLSGSPSGTVFAASTDLRAPHELVSVDMSSSRVVRLGRKPNAVAGQRGLAWVEPVPGDEIGATRVRVRPFGARTATAFGLVGLDTYYVRWVNATTLLAVSVTGLDLFADALSAHPLRIPLGLHGRDFVPEVTVQTGGGVMSFGLAGPDSIVHYVVVRL